MSDMEQISAAEYQRAIVLALRRFLSHGAPLSSEERHAAFGLMCDFADELERDTILVKRLDDRRMARLRGEPL